MCSRLCFILFVVPLSLSSANLSIDPNTLRDVFGNPKTYRDQIASQSVQAVAVTPGQGTLEETDIWESDNYAPAAADYDKFDWTLTKRVAASSSDNFLLSPLGLKLALAILTEAATGSTQSELASVLGFDLDTVVVRKKFSVILESLHTKSSKYILNLGSRIYIENNVEPRQRFSAIAKEFYKTELATTDFNQPSVAAREINSWVANITEGRITNLVTDDEVSEMVVLVLNTLFFKGTWRHQFAPNRTELAPFYTSPKTQKQVLFMNTNSSFYYTESARFDAKILRLPYLGKKFAMYIIVPNSLTGLPRVLNSLSELRGELTYLKERTVDVTIPKFQFEYTSQLDSVLKELGVRQAFEDTASFPGIARGQLLQQRLKVSKVLQRSGIEVNELGSVAYSATEITLENKFGIDSDSVEEVIANKPFLFFIQDEETRQLLFTGRVADPSAVDGAFKFS